MAIRIMATVLEQVGNPVSALDSLRYCLEELHSLSAAQENFSVLLKKGFKSIFGKDQRNEIVAFVCQMNRIIYDLTHEFVEDGRKCRQLFLWPCVEVGGEKIDLLRDARIAKELRGMDMEQCCVQPWSFGPQQSVKLFRIYSEASDIATNTKGQFIVAYTGKVILFDSGGNFVYSFDIPASEKLIRGVETDQADNMYVLVGSSGLLERHGFIYMFDAQAKLHHQFKFKTLTTHEVHSLILDSSGNVLVSIKQKAGNPSGEHYYHAHKDRFKIKLTVQVFSKTGERLNRVDVLCHQNSSCLCTIREERVLVLDERYSTLHSVSIKDNSDHEKIKLKGEGLWSPRVMKFHQPSELLFILSVSYDNSPRVSMYSKDGEYVRTIPLNVRIELTPFDRITTAFAVTNDGHFAYLLQRRVQFSCEEPPVVYVI
ncbi:uncharacterized protein [Montipora capricornis]|uniref:uncharacterized protein n=1 Tax=Montipora capricornis TaxID=246305 RepID=UPI0035F1AF2B